MRDELFELHPIFVHPLAVVLFGGESIFDFAVEEEFAGGGVGGNHLTWSEATALRNLVVGYGACP